MLGRRRRIVGGVGLVALAAAVAAGIWYAGSATSPGGAGARDSLGTGEEASAAIGVSGPGPAAGSGAGATPAPAQPPSSGNPVTTSEVTGRSPLLISYDTTTGILGYVITVTLTNPTADDLLWRNAQVVFGGSGAAASISIVDGPVVLRAVAPAACFAPEPAAAVVPPGATRAFTFQVDIALPEPALSSVLLDQPGCDG